MRDYLILTVVILGALWAFDRYTNSKVIILRTFGNRCRSRVFANSAGITCSIGPINHGRAKANEARARVPHNGRCRAVPAARAVR
jgi:hypothetical protein